MKNLATVIYLWGALLLGLTAGLSLIRQTPARAQLLAYTQIDYQASLAEVYLINRYGETLEALSQGQYWFPQWSPDGQQVIATSQLLYNRDLYRLESDFSRPFPLVFDFKNDWNPVWSPEGERVAFVSDRGGQNDIFLIQPQTLQVEQLTRDSNSNFEPSWSPGGDWIAFTSLRDVDLEVYKMRADGTEAQNLSQSPGDDGSPAWSPRGDWIAFASRRGGGPADIYRTRPEGGGDSPTAQ
jgi:TolB protein